jgi:hypothetical protein
MHRSQHPAMNVAVVAGRGQHFGPKKMKRWRGWEYIRSLTDKSQSAGSRCKACDTFAVVLLPSPESKNQARPNRVLAVIQSAVCGEQGFLALFRIGRLDGNFAGQNVDSTNGRIDLACALRDANSLIGAILMPRADRFIHETQCLCLLLRGDLRSNLLRSGLFARLVSLENKTAH